MYYDKDELNQLGVQLVTGQHLVEVSEHDYVRHRTEVLAEMIYEIALQEISTIQFDPDQFKS